MHCQGAVVDECDLTRRIECMRVRGVVAEVQRACLARTSRSELVEAQPAGDNDEPPLWIGDAGDVGAGQPGERFLHHVLGVAEVQQHAKGEIGAQKAIPHGLDLGATRID